MAFHVGARVLSMTLDPERDEGPRRHADIQVEWPIHNLSETEFQQKSILVALAGPVAEMLHRGEPLHPGFVAEWVAEWTMAWKAAAKMFSSEPKRLTYLEQTTSAIYQLLDRDENWAVIAAIVDDMLAHETLEGDHVESIYLEWTR